MEVLDESKRVNLCAAVTLSLGTSAKCDARGISRGTKSPALFTPDNICND